MISKLYWLGIFFGDVLMVLKLQLLVFILLGLLSLQLPLLIAELKIRLTTQFM